MNITEHRHHDEPPSFHLHPRLGLANNNVGEKHKKKKKGETPPPPPFPPRKKKKKKRGGGGGCVGGRRQRKREREREDLTSLLSHIIHHLTLYYLLYFFSSLFLPSNSTLFLPTFLFLHPSKFQSILITQPIHSPIHHPNLLTSPNNQYIHRLQVIMTISNICCTYLCFFLWGECGGRGDKTEVS